MVCANLIRNHGLNSAHAYSIQYKNPVHERKQHIHNVWDRSVCKIRTRFIEKNNV